MFLKNTIKSFLIAALFISSIAISTNAEAARKPQLSTKATVATCVAATVVVIAGLAIIASWVGAKCYFASKRAEKHLDLLRKYTSEASNAESTEENKIVEAKIKAHENLKNGERELYLKTICSSPKSLSREYPSAWMENDLHANRFFRFIIGFFSRDYKKINSEIEENMATLRSSESFEKERKTYNESRIDRKSLFNESWGNKLSGFGNLLTGFANVKTAQANGKIAKNKK